MTEDAGAQPPRSRWKGLVRFSERLEARRAGKVPQPWPLRKLTLGIALGLLGYTYYVYVVRFCIAMIRREVHAQGSRGQGVAYIVIFNIMYLMVLWAYARIIFTPPGYARDHVPKSASPEHQWEYPDRQRDDYSEADSYSAGGGRVPPLQTVSRRSRSASILSPTSPTSPARVQANENLAQMQDLEKARLSTVEAASSGPAESPGRTRPVSALNDGETGLDGQRSESPAQTFAREYKEELQRRSQVSLARPSSQAEEHARAEDPSIQARDVHELDAIPAIAAVRHADMMQGVPNPQIGRPLKDVIEREPPQVAILSPDHRYCWRCSIIKPPRTHHCRICGTCVLQFDHHCPWIGQCVGARNRRFFLIFNFYTVIFCLWTFVTLVIGNARDSDNVDAQEIVIAILTILFALFTAALSITHVQLLCLNMTTVENIGAERMRARERSLLNSAFEIWQLRQKRMKLQEWDQKWGRIGREGNLWWLESDRANWEAIMGKHPINWLLPIGSSFSDGLSYPTNPRFDEYGLWRRREEWPEALR